MNIFNNKRTIQPERKYTVLQASVLLGVHRCTIYTYIKLFGITPEKTENGAHLLISGETLAIIKSNPPKRGRKNLLKKDTDAFARPDVSADTDK